MPEDVNMDVAEVVQPTETETVQDIHESIEPQKGSAEYNFREARRIMDQQSREINELKYHLQNLHQKAEPVEEDPTDGDYLTKRQAREMAEEIAEQRLAQREFASAEDKMRLKYKDYDDVVNDKSVQELFEDSDLAATLRSAPDPYAAAYKMIKKLNSHHPKPTPKKNQDAQKIAQNVSKPVSSNAVQSRPLAEANAFANSSADERRAAYLEMVGAAGRR